MLDRNALTRPKAFDESISELEAKYQPNDPINPYFADEFEGLHQHYDMADVKDMLDSTLQLELSRAGPLMSLFANRPTKLTRVELLARDSPAKIMSNLFNYVGTHRSLSAFLMAIKGAFSLSTFRKL